MDTRSVEAKGAPSISVVLYEGPLVHDQNWVIKAGPPGPDNQKFRAFGGTCSMIPADLHNSAGSGFERVTFQAERQDLGLWKMTWTDTVTGTASDGNSYTYRQEDDYQSITTDGRPPRPNRAAPTTDSDGFLQFIATNVKPDATEVFDFFTLRNATGDVVANSRLHWTWRLQIQPADMDPPPDFFPAVVDGFVLHTHDQLGGQTGCDPV